MKSRQQKNRETSFRSAPCNGIIKQRRVVSPSAPLPSLPQIGEIKIVLMQHGSRRTKKGKSVPTMTEVYSDSDEVEPAGNRLPSPSEAPSEPLKRSSNAFFQYRSDPRVKERWTSKSGKHQQRHVVQDISIEWNKLSAAEKLPYERKAMHASELYKRNLHRQLQGKQHDQIPSNRQVSSHSSGTNDTGVDTWYASMMQYQLHEQLISSPMSFDSGIVPVELQAANVTDKIFRGAIPCIVPSYVGGEPVPIVSPALQFEFQGRHWPVTGLDDLQTVQYEWPRDLSWMSLAAPI